MQCPSLTDRNNPTAAAVLPPLLPHTHCLRMPGDLPAELSPNLRRVFTPWRHTNTVCDQLTTRTLQPGSENYPGNHNGLLLVVLIQPVLVKFTPQSSCTGCSFLVYLDDRTANDMMVELKCVYDMFKIHENISEVNRISTFRPF